MSDERTDEEKYPQRHVMGEGPIYVHEPKVTDDPSQSPAQAYIQEWHTKGYTGEYTPQALTGEREDSEVVQDDPPILKGEALVEELTKDVYGEMAAHRMNPENDIEGESGHVRWETTGKLNPKQAQVDSESVYPPEVRDRLHELRKKVEDLKVAEGEERAVDPRTGGVKGRKPERHSLVPVFPQDEVARVYGHGAVVYEDNNWRKGYPYSWSMDALKRHINAFWSGESTDEKGENPSHLHHLAHAAFHLFTLMEFERLGLGTDDRQI